MIVVAVDEYDNEKDFEKDKEEECKEVENVFCQLGGAIMPI